MKYLRQLELFGEDGQKKLEEAKIALIGAGGLGCPVMTNLVAAGLKNLTIFDHDVIEISNLNRQFLYSEAEIGKKKTDVLRSKFHVKTVDMYINEGSIDLLDDFSIIADCTDNAKTKLVLNDYAVKTGKYLSMGSVNGYYGFHINIESDKPCLRCMGYRDMNASKNAIGAVCSVVGGIQTMEIIKKILAIPLKYGLMSYYDGIENEFDYIEFEFREDCMIHGGSSQRE